jgi:aromatic-amino-acid transaminase
MSWLEPGQQLLTTSQYWGPYQTLCEEHGRRLDTFNMFSKEGGLDLAALDAKLTDHLATQGRVLLFLNDPCQNPTGYSMSPAEWSQVVERLLAHASQGPITLLVDMAYFLYGAAAEPRAFLSSLVPLLGKVGLLFAWSASKSYTHYGLRVGALIACVQDDKERAQVSASLAYSCRGTWSNCNAGGLIAVTRMLIDPALAKACDAERDVLKHLLQARVEAFNTLARPKGLVYPRYEGGFFVTVFTDDAKERALRMKEKGVFVVPGKGSLRVALCSVPARDVGRVVDALSA